MGRINSTQQRASTALFLLLEKNRYSEALEAKRLVLRREIDDLERNQNLNEATIDYVLNFVTYPAKLWKDADLEAKQAYQRILFPNGLHFDIKEKKVWNGRT